VNNSTESKHIINIHTEALQPVSSAVIVLLYPIANGIVSASEEEPMKRRMAVTCETLAAGSIWILRKSSALDACKKFPVPPFLVLL